MNKYLVARDKPDSRDHRMAAPTNVKLPNVVDLRPLCSPVEDQGDLGSCTGNAIVGALEYLENLKHAKFANLSRLFVYYNERMIEGTVGTDSGAQIRDGIKSIARWGVCNELVWPYDVSKFTLHPPPAAYEDATPRKALAYKRVNQNLNDILSCLASGFPIVFGFNVYESFESPAVATSGVLGMPRPGESLLGGHAVLAVGYDMGARCILVRNSWGAAWGIKGYFWMPFNYLTSLSLASDLWVIQK